MRQGEHDPEGDGEPVPVSRRGLDAYVDGVCGMAGKRSGEGAHEESLWQACLTMNRRAARSSQEAPTVRKGEFPTWVCQAGRDLHRNAWLPPP